MKSFSFSTMPKIYFSAGACSQLEEILLPYGRQLLLLTGGHSFDQSDVCQHVLRQLEQTFSVRRLRVDDEPSPEWVDQAVALHLHDGIDMVLAIGGGSVLDAAKALAGLLPSGDSVMDYLEGVGLGKVYQGPSLPFIAVPTTAGTGSESSKNAVLSRRGVDGFKKSFRHDCLLARCVLLDPVLSLSCSKELTAACGMDALTQLLESYVSTGANPMTDALAESGLRCVRDALLTAVDDGTCLTARASMLYASCMSGLCLANAGLGSVHGLASPLGAYFPIPHGVACAAVLPAATALNIHCLRRDDAQSDALKRYAFVGRLLLQDPHLSDVAAQDGLVDLLAQWSAYCGMPSLSAYGVGLDDVPRLLAGSRGNSMQTNPIRLSDDEIAALIRDSL